MTRDRVITSVECFECLRTVIPKELGAMLRFTEDSADVSLLRDAVKEPHSGRWGTPKDRPARP